MPEHSEIFSQVALFQELAPKHYKSLRSVFHVMNEPEEAVLFEQGDLARNLYLVVQGEVQIFYKPEDGEELLVARVGPQGAVGWSAALGNPSYTSSAVCTTECTLLRVSGDELRSLCEKDPECAEVVLEKLAEVIAIRLSNTHQHILELLKEGLQNKTTVEKVKHEQA